ncbi:hypothetical protein J2795_002834 [Chryseobacterium bernardetii]|jgi:hypothetical protein|uniref:Uncharacterized protein n=2 Tax=Chryseobacterium TaxID=59732 RepID=A0A543EBM2_9FLAO|nr:MULTISPECIES: hypothetical protein [Chryseobacterium]MDR6371379.1 hypothetical protein [Chryseobacterium vietnamense]MDR6442116.1 hypothetical protein [Chryseobacterium bernardetii]MDR6488042.1 hypothetical protein [Chryseobacterium vietnamense]TQM18994.1 hypothetical protein FB551_3389 [Chryseobacterium aquifrigidense]
MKIAYIIPLLFLSTIIYAQENKKAAPIEEDQALVVKQAQEQQAKLMQEAKENNEKVAVNTGLPSDHSLAVKKQETKAKAATDNSGKLLPNTASLEDLKKTIPNRQAYRNTINSRNTKTTVTGLPNTATLEEIKKTIPKN